jgi:purine nucleosidase
MYINKRKLIIDTDPGHDDALAILLAFKSNQFDIQALTTVAGNSTIENVTRNAKYILSLLENVDVPVHSGEGSPLTRELIQAVVHGESGLDGVDTYNTDFTMTGDAVDRIIEIVKSDPGNVTILALGPLSNIARALIEDPSIARDVKEIVMMGGAINVAGNKNRVAEFNMFVDPEAASIVFKSEIKKVLIPLDACNDVVLRLTDFEELKDTSYYVPIMSMMEKFIEGIGRDEGVQGALVYDAVAAYYLLNPEAFKIEEMDIVVETEGEYTFGMTVAEKRLGKSNNINCRVGMKVDEGQFRKDFLGILKRE